MTNYGFGYGPPRSLAGLIHALRGDPSSSFVLGCCTCSGAACWSSSSFIWSGGHLCHQVLVLGRAKYQTYLQEMPRLGKGRAQVAAILVQAKPGMGASRAGLWLRPSAKYASWFVLVRWWWQQGKLSQLLKKGVIDVANFITCRNSKKQKASLVYWQATAATAADSCDGAVVVALVPQLWGRL